jgi:outer membrane protein assembly factor BamA
VTVDTTVHADSGLVDVSAHVTEGARHVLRDVEITGADRTSPSLVARTLKLDIGEPVDFSQWARARSQLYDTGVFRRVDIEEEPMSTDVTTAVEKPVRARVTLEEWPPVHARYGMQIADELKPASESRDLSLGVSGDLTYRNVLGRAVSAGVAGRLDASFRAARMFVTAPTVVGRPITSNLFVSRSREELGQTTTRPFLTDKLDFTGEQRLRLKQGLDLGYSYNYQRNHTFDARPVPGDPIGLDISVNVARVTGTLLRDTRDDLVDATRGWFHSSTVEDASQALGSDVRFVKYVLQQYYYRSLPGHVVLASAGRLGLAKAFGQHLIPSERFFAGGGTTVRGFAQNGLGPTDFFGAPLGGDALLVLNQEVRFPVFKWFRGVGFMDAGNVFASAADVSLRDLKPSVGIGVRIQTPVALIRVDFGMPITRQGERRGRWTFSVGQVF